MKYYMWCLSFLSVVFFNFNAGAVPSGSESFTYKMRYMWVIPIGKSHISVEPESLDNKAIYKISASYKSPFWSSLFFKAQGSIHSYVDSQTLLPIRYEALYSYTGHSQTKDVLEYDQAGGNLSIDLNGRKEAAKIPANSTLDPLSALYFLKQQSWTVGEHRVYPINSHQSTYQLSLKCVAQERVKTALGTKESWVLSGSIQRPDLIIRFPVRAEFKIWVDQETRLPLKADIKTQVGYITLIRVQS